MSLAAKACSRLQRDDVCARFLACNEIGPSLHEAGALPEKVGSAISTLQSVADYMRQAGLDHVAIERLRTTPKRMKKPAPQSIAQG
jgi:hypothetical protein